MARPTIKKKGYITDDDEVVEERKPIEQKDVKSIMRGLTFAQRARLAKRGKTVERDGIEVCRTIENVYFARQTQMGISYKDMTAHVVGLLTLEQQRELYHICKDRKIKSVYLGANRSYTAGAAIDEHRQWEGMARFFCRCQLMTSFEFPVTFFTILRHSKLFEIDYIAPVVRVEWPSVEDEKRLTVIKLDDSDPRSSTPGSWAWMVGNLVGDQSAYTAHERNPANKKVF